MDLRNLFSKISFDSNSKEQPTKKDAPSHWVKCPECNALMFFKEVENQDNICPKCNFHMRIGAKRRIEILTDKDSFVEFDVELKPNDPLKFVDKTSYKKRVEEALKTTGRTSSVVSGEALINDIPVQMVVFDFSLVLFDDMLYYNKVYERDVVDMIDNNTQFFRTQPEKTISVEGILEQVYLALKEKGYNPVNQIVGYIMSGDPTYITSHNNARSLIMKVERDELVEEVIKYFIEGKGL